MAVEKKKNDDLTKVRQLVKLMVDNDLVEMEIIEGDNKISLKRPQPAQPQMTMMPQMAFPPMAGVHHIMPAAHTPAQPPAASGASAGTEAEADQDLIDITSPIVGTFYSAPSPDSDPYVTVGARVTPDTVVCIVEAMKVMNEIKAETTGTIEKVLCKAGQAIEYGQVLFKVRPH